MWLPLLLLLLSLPFFTSSLFSPPFPSQSVWFCSQEARQHGRERLPLIRWVGPRPACFCHRQLYQQGHAVSAPIEGDKERKTLWKRGTGNIYSRPAKAVTVHLWLCAFAFWWGMLLSVWSQLKIRVRFLLVVYLFLLQAMMYSVTTPSLRRLQRKWLSNKANKHLPRAAIMKQANFRFALSQSRLTFNCLRFFGSYKWPIWPTQKQVKQGFRVQSHWVTFVFCIPSTNLEAWGLVLWSLI